LSVPLESVGPTVSNYPRERKASKILPVGQQNGASQSADAGDWRRADAAAGDRYRKYRFDLATTLSKKGAPEDSMWQHCEFRKSHRLCAAGKAVMSTREKRFSIAPGRSVVGLDPFCVLRCPVGQIGARFVLIAAIGFLGAVVLGFGRADRSTSHGPPLRVEVGDPSPMVIRHGEAPAAKPAPMADAECRP
jgi:hypothetical protein